jgi:hypothetical protein
MHEGGGAADIETQRVIAEQYKVYVVSADQVSARRQVANGFFLTLNALLLGGTGYIVTKDNALQLGFAVTGMLLSLVWFFLIGSFRKLNRAKFDVIHQLEQVLPARPFAAEWKLLSGAYIGSTRFEMFLPFVFFAAYAALMGTALGVIPKLI